MGLRTYVRMQDGAGAWVKRRGRPPGVGRTKPVETRDCSRHGSTEFALYGKKPSTTRWRCKRCVGEAVTRRHQKIKRTLVEEHGGGCAVCGYDRCLVSLQFHHVDPAAKEFGVSVASGKALDTFRKEAQKCVLVCANCHGEIEAGLIASPPPMSRFGG